VEKRRGDEQEIIAPEFCPTCGSQAVRLDGEVALRCENINCPVRLKESRIFLASRTAMVAEPATIKRHKLPITVLNHKEESKRYIWN
jgi:NAD-dependent DNA ligase